MSGNFEVTCVWDLKAILGEGPIWSAKDHAVWFVDIKSSKIHRYDVSIGSKQSWTAPSPCGFIAPRKRGGFGGRLQERALSV
nr:SMP-30/gluconolactonase/LRE family protein [Asticcacaulis sp. SL142]